MSQIIQPGNVLDAKLPPHIQRVLKEGDDLCERIAKLAQFLASPGFKGVEETEKYLLMIQMDTMQTYLKVLTLRLNRARDAARFAQARSGINTGNTGNMDKH